MTDWCPHCGAMLTPGTKKCPRCGQRQRRSNNTELSIRDAFWLTLTTLGYVLIPLVVIIVVAVLCILLSR